jgi:hypothetical protein
MKKLSLIIATFALSVAAFGASVDGKWTMEQKAKDATVTVTFELKSDGGKVMGTMSRSVGKAKTMTIQNGKIEGDKLSFDTIAHNKKKGDVRTHWEGTVSDSQITGHRKADQGKGKGAAFTMKRSS